MAKASRVKSLTSIFILIFVLSSIAALTGCGTGDDGTASTTSSSSSSTTPTSSTTLTLSLTSNTVSFGTPVTATATVRDSNGTGIQGLVVTFASTTSSLITFTPTSATALTNASGVASISINAASIDSAGAASITASTSLTSGGTTSILTTAPMGIAINGATVTLGAISLGQSSISAYGSSSVSVPVLVGGLPATVPISVAFSSNCVNASKATISTPVTTVSGTATSTYRDNGCSSATDTITASVTGATASTSIAVAIPATSNIQFVSATPPIIGTQTAGAATLPKSSVVKFKVVDSNNNGKAGVVVDFSLTPASVPGGITLSSSSATSDSNGEVMTTVTSGTVPTPLWVVAKVHSTPTILSQSNTLTITTGLPTQNFFSLSNQTYNIEGWSNDGVTSTLSIIASDRLGNPVPDGTAINFITEGGNINPASCTTASGTCSVTFKSAALRPTNGRVTVLAYALGEESFVDLNGNNIYDSGETFYNLGDIYIDANENGVWDTGETYIALNLGTSACLTRPAGTPLPYGLDVPSKQNTCSGVWEQNYVRRSTVIVLSGSVAYITTTPPTDPLTVAMGPVCNHSFTLSLYDVNNNPMPAGTTLVTANNNVYYGATGYTPGTAAVSITRGSPVQNTSDRGGTEITLTVSGGASCLGLVGNPGQYYPTGTVDIQVATPLGIITSIPITVN